MKKEKSIVTSVVVGLILVVVFTLFVGFIALIAFQSMNETPKTVHKVIIPQKIGGELICEATKEDDVLFKKTKVSYYYKNGADSAFFIGEGDFFNVEWSGREQLIKIGDWYYLRTGAGRTGENLNFGKLEAGSQWWQFTFSPEQIATDSVWQSNTISTYTPDICAYMRILNIDTVAKSLIVHYDLSNPKGKNLYPIERCRIIYKLDSLSGEPRMFTFYRID